MLRCIRNRGGSAGHAAQITSPRYRERRELTRGERARAISPQTAAVLGVIADAQIELGMYPESVATIQQMVNLLQPEAAQTFLPTAAKHGVGVVARQVIFKGFLTDAVTRETVFAENDMRSRTPRETINGYFDRIDGLAFLWAGGKRRRIEAAIQYALSLPAVGTVICGAVTQQELADAVAAGDAAPLSDEEAARVAQVQQAQLAAAIAH